MSLADKAYFIAGSLGIANSIGSKYGFNLPNTEIDFWVDIVCYAAVFYCGIKIDKDAIGNMIKGKRGV